MEPIAISSNPAASWIIILTTILVIIVSQILIFKFTNSTMLAKLVLAFTLFAFLIIFTLVASTTSRVEKEQRNAAIGSTIKDNYGVELTYEEIDNLDYPEEAPTSDFEVLGNYNLDVKTENGFERSEVFLVWSDNKLILAKQESGGTYAELVG